MPGKGRDRQRGPVCSPKRGVSFSTTLTFFFFLFPLARSCGMWDLSSPTSDLGTGRWSLNHWTARKVPQPCTILNITYHHHQKEVWFSGRYTKGGINLLYVTDFR